MDLRAWHAGDRESYPYLGNEDVFYSGPTGFESPAIRAALWEQELSLAPASSPQRHGYLARGTLGSTFPSLEAL
ncbi:hypothetical protein SAMD00023353_0301350 [Rosellinia necatrix]|uniref:Uncharacterized protein n=1 Tax=Rosellinia necatrix TaxID=77044 RepID=A0A1S8A5G9_ROSNE|nr:hypothetical protein SAMD00023353_0301350 [Rosellinia necatrix]